MINTIFRFVPNEATYRAEWNSNQISARTIVFCEQEGSIYKNDVKYAGGKDGIDGLPGVDGKDGGGTTKERIEKLIGDAVKVTPNTSLTGTTIATIKVNNNTYTLKAPTSTNNEGEGNTEYETVEVQANEDNHGIEIGRIKVGSNPWVVFRSPFSSNSEDPDNPQPEQPTIPKDVLDKINELDGDIDQLKSDLQDLHDQNEQGINDTVQEALDEWAAFKGANGLVGTNGEWEWTKDADGNPLFFSTLGWTDSTTGTWSSIKQRINSLELSVKGIVDNGDGLYDISEALIKQWVELNVDGTYIANALMNASYANADDDGNVLKWLVSGFKASAASGKTVAQMFSDSSEGAIAGVMTEVNKKADSDEVENVKASLAAMWGDGAIAGANAVADPSKVRASLFATNADKTASAKIIVDAINNSTDSSIILDASKIYITADFINAINSQLTTKSLSAVSGSSRIDINSTDGIKQTISGVITNQIKQNGSGSFANGNISWDTTGSATIKGHLTTGGSGFRWDMYPGSEWATLNLTNDTDTVIRISGDSTTGGWVNVYGSNGYSSMYNGGIFVYNSSSANLASISGSNGYGLITAQNASGSNYAILSGNRGVVTVGDSSGSNELSSTGVLRTSDVRLKNIIADKVITAEQIGAAPAFIYNPINNGSVQLVGTSAQYWEDVLPEAVRTINDYLAIDYSTVATISVINLAKEVITLKEEKSALTERVEALEARLQLIENNLNA